MTFDKDTSFWKRVDKGSPDECWNWKGNLFTNGYGQLGFVHRGSRLAHRYSYLIHNGTVCNDNQVLHKCDNKKCVNPNHLFLGSQSDNIQDMINKGRDNIYFKNGGSVGEKNTKSKLNETDVEEIKRKYNTGLYTQLKLSEIFGISRSAISHITRNYTWRHI